MFDVYQNFISETKKRAKEIIFIETLGTNVELPNPPGEKLSQFYHAFNHKKKNGKEGIK